jgi:peptidoglycan hydrolase-like protein with peptidoglycan-binding domain
MLPGRLTMQLAAFALLSIGVGANVFFLQSREPSPGATEEPLWNLASAQNMEVGDTGSIDRADESPTAPDLPKAAAAVAHDPPPPAVMSAADLTKAVQRELQIRGYETGARDGVAGLMTRGAILAFEYDHGLPLTARPSQELLKAILLGDVRAKKKRAAGTETAEAQDVIRSVQRSLARLGYRPGAANGRMTRDTERAIRAFELDQTLPESGRVSGPLISRLARLSGDGKVASSRR